MIKPLAYTENIRINNILKVYKKNRIEYFLKQFFL